MKQFKQVVEETDLEKLEAFKILKTNDSIGAKEFTYTPFRLKGYVIAVVTITDDETGEVKQSLSISLLTETGEVIGTNSQSIVKTFKEIQETFEDEIYSMDLQITTGKTKSGNTFLSLELA